MIAHGLGRERILGDHRSAAADYRVVERAVLAGIADVHPAAEHRDGGRAALYASLVRRRIHAAREAADHGYARPRELPCEHVRELEPVARGFSRADHSEREPAERGYAALDEQRRGHWVYLAEQLRELVVETGDPARSRAFESVEHAVDAFRDRLEFVRRFRRKSAEKGRSLLREQLGRNGQPPYQRVSLSRGNAFGVLKCDKRRRITVASVHQIYFLSMPR